MSYASAAALVLGCSAGRFFPISRAGGAVNVSFALAPSVAAGRVPRRLLRSRVADLGRPLAVLGGFIVVVGGIGLASAQRRAGAIMTVLVIAPTTSRRLVRERGNLFFVFALPLMLILVLGVTWERRAPHRHPRRGQARGVQELIDGSSSCEGIEVVCSTISTPRPTNWNERTSPPWSSFRPDMTRLSPRRSGRTRVPGDSQAVAALRSRAWCNRSSPTRTPPCEPSRLVSEQTGLHPEQASDRAAASPSPRSGRGRHGRRRSGQLRRRDAVGFVAAQELVLFMFLIGMIARRPSSSLASSASPTHAGHPGHHLSGRRR